MRVCVCLCRIDTKQKNTHKQKKVHQITIYRLKIQLQFIKMKIKSNGILQEIFGKIFYMQKTKLLFHPVSHIILAVHNFNYNGWLFVIFFLCFTLCVCVCTVIVCCVRFCGKCETCQIWKNDVFYKCLCVCGCVDSWHITKKKHQKKRYPAGQTTTQSEPSLGKHSSKNKEDEETKTLEFFFFHF